jgi:ADP-heptose:LPS heptosyltransferase
MSLPAVFGTVVDTVPWPGAYLGADPILAAEKRAQFAQLQPIGNPLRVGLAWAGNPSYKGDRQRSMRLTELLPLLRTPGVTWISLQKGSAAGQLAALPNDISVLDGSSHDRDLADTAALVANLDLVVTTDTCIAHLAGAMAKRVWVLLPHLPDWRWMRQIETTPWYPTARLFRQPAPGDWPAPVQRLAAELVRLRHPTSRQFKPFHALPS